MRFRKPKQVEYQASEAGTVGVAKMARILGITRQHLSDLARAGRVPTTIVRGARRYDVDRILDLASRCSLPLPPLRRQAWYYEDTLWACEALSRGPWNLPTAPTGRAWYLYLLAKRDKVIRRRLTQFALKVADMGLTRAKLDGFNGSSEEGAVKAGFKSMEPVASDGALPMAERAMKAIESGLVAGPYEPDPVNQKDDVGY